MTHTPPKSGYHLPFTYTELEQPIDVFHISVVSILVNPTAQKTHVAIGGLICRRRGSCLTSLETL
jgi:hypothetical protein